MLEELLSRYPSLTACREDIAQASQMLIDCYRRGGKLLLFTSEWNLNWAVEHNPDLKLSEFGNVTF